MNTFTFNGLKIEQLNEDVYYITLDNLVVYIDNSTGENIVNKWIEKDRIIEVFDIG
jgi:hypothetical protein